MTDYDPFGKPAPPRVERPPEFLWEFHNDKNHATYRCELRYHGEWGVEAQIFRDGDLQMAQRFNLRAQAVAWADGERKHRETYDPDDDL